MYLCKYMHTMVMWDQLSPSAMWVLLINSHVISRVGKNLLPAEPSISPQSLFSLFLFKWNKQVLGDWYWREVLR